MPEVVHRRRQLEQAAAAGEAHLQAAQHDQHAQGDDEGAEPEFEDQEAVHEADRSADQQPEIADRGRPSRPKPPVTITMRRARARGRPSTPATGRTCPKSGSSPRPARPATALPLSSTLVRFCVVRNTGSTKKPISSSTSTTGMSVRSRSRASGCRSAAVTRLAVRWAGSCGSVHGALNSPSIAPMSSVSGQPAGSSGRSDRDTSPARDRSGADPRFRR